MRQRSARTTSEPLDMDGSTVSATVTFARDQRGRVLAVVSDASEPLTAEDAEALAADTTIEHGGYLMRVQESSRMPDGNWLVFGSVWTPGS